MASPASELRNILVSYLLLVIEVRDIPVRLSSSAFSTLGNLSLKYFLRSKVLAAAVADIIGDFIVHRDEG
jgi:hypothetical protein